MRRTLVVEASATGVVQSDLHVEHMIHEPTMLFTHQLSIFLPLREQSASSLHLRRVVDRETFFGNSCQKARPALCHAQRSLRDLETGMATPQWS